MTEQIGMRPKVARLVKRFMSAEGVRNVPEMLRIVKRLGYKEDCPPETIRNMRERIDKIATDD